MQQKMISEMKQYVPAEEIKYKNKKTQKLEELINEIINNDNIKLIVEDSGKFKSTNDKYKLLLNKEKLDTTNYDNTDIKEYGRHK